MTFSKTFKIPKHLGGLCAPSKIYAVLAILSCVVYVFAMMNADSSLALFDSSVGAHGYTVMGLLFKSVFSVFWIILLNYICKTFKHGTAISWVILLLPLFFFMFALFLMLFAVSQVSRLHNGVAQKQGSYEDQQTSFEQRFKESMNHPSVVTEEEIPQSQDYGYDVQGFAK
jgi:hypothetical protein